MSHDKIFIINTVITADTPLGFNINWLIDFPIKAFTITGHASDSAAEKVLAITDDIKANVANMDSVLIHAQNVADAAYATANALTAPAIAPIVRAYPVTTRIIENFTLRSDDFIPGIKDYAILTDQWMPPVKHEMPGPYMNLNRFNSTFRLIASNGDTTHPNDLTLSLIFAFQG